MGQFLRPRGLKGVIWFMIFNEVNSSLKVGKCLWIDLGNGENLSLFIESIGIAGKKSWIKLTDYDSRNDILKLCGLNFSISRVDFEPVLNDEIYLVDLIGCNILDKERKLIGCVVDTMVMPANNILVVDVKGKEYLVPFVKSCIKFFDKEKNTLILSDVEGLIV